MLGRLTRRLVAVLLLGLLVAYNLRMGVRSARSHLVYRLGDLVRFKKTKEPTLQDFVRTSCPADSLGRRFQTARDAPSNIAADCLDVFAGVVRQTPLPKGVPGDIMHAGVLHVRTGDVLCVHYTGMPEDRHQYAKEQFWIDTQRQFRAAGVSRVVLISGNHLNLCHKESEKLVQTCLQRLAALGFADTTVDKDLVNTPASVDRHVLMAVAAGAFASTGGGYGEIIQETRKRRGRWPAVQDS
jgi:hypothetical protein